MPTGFDTVLQQLRGGIHKRWQRQGWNGKGMYIYLAEGVNGFEPFIAMKTADDKFVPWLASQTDILATDWQVQSDFQH